MSYSFSKLAHEWLVKEGSVVRREHRLSAIGNNILELEMKLYFFFWYQKLFIT